MRFSLKEKIHRQILGGWESDETDRLSDTSEKKEDSDCVNGDNELWFNRFNDRRKERQGTRSRLRSIQLVDEAFDTKPPVVSVPTTIVMLEDDMEMTLHEGDYPSMDFSTSDSPAKPALLTTPPKPRLIKPVPKRSQHGQDMEEDSVVEHTLSSSEHETIKDDDLVKVLRENGMKVHFLDFADVSPSKKVRRHYWVTPISNEPKTQNVSRTKLIEDTLAELQRRNQSPPKAPMWTQLGTS